MICFSAPNFQVKYPSYVHTFVDHAHGETFFLVYLCDFTMVGLFDPLNPPVLSPLFLKAHHGAWSPLKSRGESLVSKALPAPLLQGQIPDVIAVVNRPMTSLGSGGR